MKRQTIKGEFQLGLNSNGVFTLRIRDTTSNVQFLEGTIQPADLILAITGRADMPIEVGLVELDALALLGKVAVARSVGLDPGDVELHAKGWKYLRHDHPHRESQRLECWSWIEGAALAKAKEQDEAAGVEWRPGWSLKSDGIDTQQPTALHRVTLIRYDEPAPTSESPTAEELS